MANLVGAENEGWSVAKYLLDHERNGVAGVTYLYGRLNLVQTVAAALIDEERSSVRSDADALRLEQARLAVELLSLEALADPMIVEDPQGCRPSILKLRGSEVEQAITDLGRRCLGPYAAVDFAYSLEHTDSVTIGPAGAGDVMLGYFMGRAATIFGGSSEVQRNIIFKQLARAGL